ncbi:hypothetical protein [Limnohabitans sp. 2KL-1]|uniref:hypothetical protein n=1 Tax=Limnohabitans sp. 2KL-1 TaxID=1100699 RepID=UPI0011B285DD|nr:hypothetical protein [Limnohabitans sp. 2KL-1]
MKRNGSETVEVNSGCVVLRHLYKSSKHLYFVAMQAQYLPEFWVQSVDDHLSFLYEKATFEVRMSQQQIFFKLGPADLASHPCSQLTQVNTCFCDICKVKPSLIRNRRPS